MDGASVNIERSGTEPGFSRWQRMLMPGAMVDGHGGGRGRGGPGRTLRDWVVDALVLAVALAIGISVLATTWTEHGAFFLGVDMTLGLASCAALWFRRSHPRAVAAGVIAASTFSGLAAGAALIAVFNVALRGDRRAVTWTAVAALVCWGTFELLFPSGNFVGELLMTILVLGFAIGWGLFIRGRRDLFAALHERAARLEAESRLRAEQAREAERRRIAREMHDVVAHRLSLLSLHASALEFRPDATPEEIAEAGAVIRRSAHAALEELRDVVGVLREGTDAATRPPQPSLRDLAGLIDEARAAGMRVEAELSLPAADGEVSELAGRTAYRIVQEGLTNARKHAPAARVTVRAVLTAEGLLEVELRNPRPVGVGVGVGTNGPAMPGGGSGLIGLGERVGLAGGTLRHGEDESGEYALRATFPAVP